MRKRLRILGEAIDSRNSIQNGEISVGSALSKLNSIVFGLKKQSDYTWIEKELNGYEYESAAELIANLPKYRILHRQWYNQYGRKCILQGEGAIELLSTVPVKEPMGFLENNKKSYNAINHSESELIRENFGIQGANFKISEAEISKAIESVRMKVISVLDKIINDLEEEIPFYEEENKIKPDKVKDLSFLKVILISFKRILDNQERFLREQKHFGKPITILTASLYVLVLLAMLAGVAKVLSMSLTFLGLGNSGLWTLILIMCVIILMVVLDGKK